LVTLVAALCTSAFAAEPPPPASAPLRVDVESIVPLTYRHNLRIAAEKFNVDGAELQFQGFERNLSQFVPLIVESSVDREQEDETVGTTRERDSANEGRVSVGMEKEFFDGTRVAANTGMRAADDRAGRNSNPFVELDLRFPLFSSFTKLERVTERSFEESEMFSAWLDFIETVRDAISESQEAYFELQRGLDRERLAREAIDDLRRVLDHPSTSARPRDTAQLRDEIQSYQSQLVDRVGDVAAARINLLNQIGVEELAPEAVDRMTFDPANFYGSHYLTRDPARLIDETVTNDVEIRVLQIARDNAELKRQLALKGRWDIVGRLFAGYDFRARGDDPAERSGYRAGVAFSVRRNDPKLLRISLLRAEAEIRKYDARVEFRRREVANELRRRLVQADSLRKVVVERSASLGLRRGVFEQKRSAYVDGADTIENLLQARSQLYDTGEELVESLGELYSIIVELDDASGRYFLQLGDAVQRFDRMSTGAVRSPGSPADS
jgi:outer membrane protein TolC